MKSNWNKRQTKKAIKALNAKLNNGDCAAFALGDFIRIVTHAHKAGVSIGRAYIEVVAGAWCLEVDTVEGDAAVYLPHWECRPTEDVHRYFGVSTWELIQLRHLKPTW